MTQFFSDITVRRETLRFRPFFRPCGTAAPEAGLVMSLCCRRNFIQIPVLQTVPYLTQ